MTASDATKPKSPKSARRIWQELGITTLEGLKAAAESQQLRTLPGAGFLLAYDDPVGLARELISFCG